MSSAVTEVQADKPVNETVEQASSESTNQTDSSNTNNDTNSSQKEVSPLKRAASQISGTANDQTPAKSTKKSRIDKFKEESEALLKSFGLKDGAASETRLTRSRTRGTPASTPVAKAEPKKPTTATKRTARKPASEKQAENEESAVQTPAKRTAVRGGRQARKQTDAEEQMDVVENSTEEAVEATKSVVANDGDKLDEPAKSEESNKIESNSDVKEPIVPVVVVTKEATTKTESAAPVEDAKEAKTNSTEESSKASENATIPTINSTSAVTTNDTKVENNLPSSNETFTVNKIVAEPTVEKCEVPVKVQEEKVSNDAKLSSESVEQKELQTA